MKIIVSIVLLFSCIFIADGSRRSDEFIYIDRPGSSLRFFKLPGVSGAVSFDFQKMYTQSGDIPNTAAIFL